MSEATAARPAAGEWRRLDRRMLVVHPVGAVVRALPVLLAALLAGSQSGRGGLWSLIGTGIVVTMGVLRWFTTTYRVTGERLEVRRGVLRRQLVSVSLDRVRTVDVSRSAMQRVLGLARINVGPGLSDRRREDALRLDGLSAAEAARLYDELRPGAARAARADTADAVPTPDTAGEEVLAEARPAWVWYAPFTLSGFLTVFVIVGFAWRI